MKKNILFLIIGMIIMGGISAIAYQFSAKDISYTPSNSNWKVSNVKEAIDDIKMSGTTKKVCTLKSGDALTIGSMYECDPGDGVKRNFYVLEVRSDSVDLIMDRNITQGSGTTTMTWNNAMKYIDNNNLKSSWKDVNNVDLPKAQAIANAVGNSSWKAVDNSSWWCLASHKQDSQSAPFCNTEQAKAYNWLYDYTRECNGCSHNLGSTEAYGYWTRDLISGASNAWNVSRHGALDYNAVSDATYDGVRPVITLSKSNLSN